MSKTFLCSDHHIGHSNICKFMGRDGITKLRPWDDALEMSEDLITNHNAVVAPEDRVYFLGDVAINRKFLPWISRFNGRKKLIRGNHDIFKTSEYIPYFDEILGSHKLGNFLLTHIPVHPDSLRGMINIHGHLHDRSVLGSDGLPDLRYRSACLEHTNYAPVELSSLSQEYPVSREAMMSYISLQSDPEARMILVEASQMKASLEDKVTHVWKKVGPEPFASFEAVSLFLKALMKNHA